MVAVEVVCRVLSVYWYLVPAGVTKSWIVATSSKSQVQVEPTMIADVDDHSSCAQVYMCMLLFCR